MFLKNLNCELDKFHLLKHAFYKDWSEGKLSLEDLGEYSKQYFHHVDAFPRYLSRVHSLCADISSRQVILHNLVDEEDGEENHPALWLQFAEELGVSETEVRSAKLFDQTKALVNGIMELCNDSYEKGLGALYTYERQVPDVAKSKIDGLKRFYNCNSKKALKFFEEHIGADEWHSQEFADLISNLDRNGKELAKEGAIESAKLLWNFLNGMQDYRALKEISAA